MRRRESKPAAAAAPTFSAAWFDRSGGARLVRLRDSGHAAAAEEPRPFAPLIQLYTCYRVLRTFTRRQLESRSRSTPGAPDPCSKRFQFPTWPRSLRNLSNPSDRGFLLLSQPSLHSRNPRKSTASCLPTPAPSPSPLRSSRPPTSSFRLSSTRASNAHSSTSEATTRLSSKPLRAGKSTASRVSRLSLARTRYEPPCLHPSTRKVTPKPDSECVILADGRPLGRSRLRPSVRSAGCRHRPRRLRHSGSRRSGPQRLDESDPRLYLCRSEPVHRERRTTRKQERIHPLAAGEFCIGAACFREMGADLKILDSST